MLVNFLKIFFENPLDPTNTDFLLRSLEPTKVIFWLYFLNFFVDKNKKKIINIFSEFLSTFSWSPLGFFRPKECELLPDIYKVPFKEYFLWFFRMNFCVIFFFGSSDLWELPFKNIQWIFERIFWKPSELKKIKVLQNQRKWMCTIIFRSSSWGFSITFLKIL